MENTFWKDDRGVAGLPIKIVVMTVVGLAGMMVILSSIPSCIVPLSLNARVSNNTISVSSYVADFPSINVKVTDRNGNPVEDATVIISGLGSSAAGITDGNGSANVSSSGKIRLEANEGYLSLRVKPPSSCYQEYRNEYAVKIFKR